MNEIDAFKQRRSDRIRERYSKMVRMDADEREPEEEAPKYHGNTRLPYGLCDKHGINLPQGATPHDAWAALEGKGYSVPWKATPEGQKTASEIKGGKPKPDTAPKTEFFEKPDAVGMEDLTKEVNKLADGSTITTGAGKVFIKENGEWKSGKDTYTPEKVAEKVKESSMLGLGGSKVGKTEDLPKTTKDKISAIKTHEDVMNVIKEMGLDANEQNLKSCAVEGLKGTLNAIHDFKNDFEMLFKPNDFNIEPLKIESNSLGGRVAATNGRTLYIGKMFDDEGKIKSNLEAQTKKKDAKHWKEAYPVLKNLKDNAPEQGWWCEGSSVESVMTHELAHVMDRYLTYYDFLEAGGGQIGWNAQWEMYDVIKKGKKTAGANIVNEAIKELKGKGQTITDMKYMISVQAAKREPNETFAEAIAEVKARGENASPLSKLIYKKMVERYEQVGGKYGKKNA